MSAVLALTQAARAGVDLQLAPDGKLKAKAPSGVASPQLLALLRAHKGELLDLLRGDRCRPPAYYPLRHQFAGRELQRGEE